MLLEKLHTLYIPLPQELHNKLLQLYKRLSAIYPNEYLDEKNFKAHVTVGTILIRDSLSTKFVETCEKMLIRCKPFEIKFTDFTTSSNQKYIFLDLTESSRKIMFGLREAFLTKTGKIHKVKIPQKYLDNWGTYSSHEKQLLKVTGSPYEYEPHVSIVKLDPASVEKALEVARSTTHVGGKSFKVTEFVVSGQSESPDEQFPVLKIIKIP
jgi:2'-5' RNA ligase